MTTAPEALGCLVGDYAGLDFAGGGARPGIKPFQVHANSGNLANRTDVFATTASTSGPQHAARALPVHGRRGALMRGPGNLAAGEASWRLIARSERV